MKTSQDESKEKSLKESRENPMTRLKRFREKIIKEARENAPKKSHYVIICEYWL